MKHVHTTDILDVIYHFASTDGEYELDICVPGVNRN